MGEFSAYKHCWIDVSVKGALLNDNVGRDTTAALTGGSVAPAGTYFNTRNADTTAFMGDISVMLVYRPTPHITMKGGYQGLFLNHVALASHNLAATPYSLVNGPATLDVSADVVYHGPRASIELTW